MAGRPVKVGLDYFELDCLMDDNIKLIQAEYGLKGFAVIVKLYQKIYSTFGYYCEWNEDILLLFMVENGVASDSKNLINDIVMACIKRGIFSGKLFEKYGILTSAGVQKRYLNATSKRERVEMKKEYLLVSVGKKSINVVINSISDGINSNSDIENSQSRVEKSREEKRNISCSELDEPASEPPVIALMLNDKSEHYVYPKDVEYWSELYPAVDVVQELRAMKGWINSNPRKRKTKRGINRFINGWLSKEQNKGGNSNGNNRRDYFTDKEEYNPYDYY